ncbi:MAG: hypothetical protein HY883_01365 [Deltaproteobacteria bacterium]|nr:hypothetical protein [Deltaproteobacteria bacterium]
MNGKINIVFGLIYLTFTALLGPLLLVPGKGADLQQMMEVGKAVDGIREEEKTGEPSAKAIAPAVVGMADYLKGAGRVGFLASTHAHGNLESLLNIAAGLVLLSLAIGANFKALLSILFLIGAIMHSGMLYLVAVFGIRWAGNFAIIGAVALVAGLFLTGVASAVGIKKAQ